MTPKIRKQPYREYTLETFRTGTHTWGGRAKSRDFTIVANGCRSEAHATKELKRKIDIWERGEGR